MSINLDHFETLEELEKHLIMWVKEEDPFSFNRYLNQEDVLKIVQMLIKSNFEIERLNNIIKEVREYIKQRIEEVEEQELNYVEYKVEEYIEEQNKLLKILDKGE